MMIPGTFYTTSGLACTDTIDATCWPLVRLFQRSMHSDTACNIDVNVYNFYLKFIRFRIAYGSAIIFWVVVWRAQQRYKQHDSWAVFYPRSRKLLSTTTNVFAQLGLLSRKHSKHNWESTFPTMHQNRGPKLPFQISHWILTFSRQAQLDALQYY